MKSNSTLFRVLSISVLFIFATSILAGKTVNPKIENDLVNAPTSMIEHFDMSEVIGISPISNTGVTDFVFEKRVIPEAVRELLFYAPPVCNNITEWSAYSKVSYQISPLFPTSK